MFFKKDGTIIKRFYRKEPSPIKVLCLRLVFIFILLLLVAGIFWGLEKDEIKDSYDGHLSYIDSLYFTIVTVTTLGYGDIVPVTERARMVDAFIITPVRMLVWVLFIGTAYQFVIQRFWEEYRMNRLLKKLKGHVIIAGYGSTGAATVNELVHKGYDDDRLIAIDKKEDNVKEAAEAGATGILGDSASEDVLTRAGIHGAAVIIITTPHDDTNVLIALTAKDLNPGIKIISRVRQHENIKQLKRAGADVIISPSLTSGNLMAVAVSNSNSVELIGELLTTSRGANVHQRRVLDPEIGKSPKALKGIVVLGLVRKGNNIGPGDLDGQILRKNDEIILIE
ncbi:MAG: potassium channel family protein [Candidatus Thermoplasmatota archaeon]|nr:potassium channel family protein [Candidatus Thermoplasmatota archaeon]MDP7266505.1 potassium channel family protein [Candidatus Thermoplasmatota archaeon]